MKTEKETTKIVKKLQRERARIVKQIAKLDAKLDKIGNKSTTKTSKARLDVNGDV